MMTISMITLSGVHCNNYCIDAIIKMQGVGEGKGKWCLIYHLEDFAKLFVSKNTIKH
jgi:hypothetical protein